MALKASTGRLAVLGVVLVAVAAAAVYWFALRGPKAPPAVVTPPPPEFGDGEAVKAGAVLFRIDPRSYEAALARAKAQMAQAQATVTQAADNFTRVEGLAARQVSTQK